MNLNPFIIYHNSIQNPQTRLLTILVTFFYLIFPFDFLPDFLPVLGQIDDAMLLLMLVVELFLLWRQSFKKKAVDKVSKI